MRRIAISAGVALTWLMWSAAVPAADATAEWASSVSGAWNNGAYWSANPNWPGDGAHSYDVIVDKTSASIAQGVSVAIQKLNLNAGTINGLAGATLTCNELLTWTGGALTGTGSVVANGGMAIGGGSKTLSRNLTNSQTATWTASSILAAAVTIVNSGTFDCQFDGNVQGPASGTMPTFQNSGTLLKSGGTGNTLLARVTLDNTGTVDVRSGALYIGGPVTQIASGTLTAGSWKIGSGASLTLASTNGNIAINQGSVTLDGLGSTFTNIDTLADNRGAFTVSGGRKFTTTGALPNSGTITVGGAGSELNVNGALTGTGNTNVAAGASLTANSIVQDTLTIGAGGSVTIGGAPVAAAGAVGAVPEPGMWVLIGTALIGWLTFCRRQRPR